MDTDTGLLNTVTRAWALPVGECLRLLASVPVGRIVYTRHALPAVEPVIFTLEDRHIVIRIEPSGALFTAIHDAVVAFQSDHIDYVDHCGWSVSVIGDAREVIDPPEVTRLRGIGLESWTAGENGCFIRISPGIVSGQKLRWPVAP